MILVCGATGELGGRIVRLLVADGQKVRALVRPDTDATGLQLIGVGVVLGDLRDPATLGPALVGIETVVTTANAISRMLAGSTDLTIAEVDGQGTQNLIHAAEEAGVRRFVLVSAAGISEETAHLSPLMAAKWAAEKALRATSMEGVVVRPDMFQEVWLSPTTGIDPSSGRALIYGRGQLPQRYVAIDDVAMLCAHVAVAPDPPTVVEFGGPEALSRMEVVADFESATGTKLHVRHVPRAIMSIGHHALARIKPEIASLMGMALFSDTHPGNWDDAPLRQIGVDPRPATAFIRESVGSTH